MTLNRISPKRKASGEKRAYNSTFAAKKRVVKQSLTTTHGRTIKQYLTVAEMKALGLVASARILKRKPTGEAKVFREIWEAREHKCEVCKRWISEPTASNFSHLLPKGSYPALRLDPRNIVIKCEKCHELWHQYGAEGLRYTHGWAEVVRLRDELKHEYHNA